MDGCVLYYITAAVNSISSQLSSSCQGNWYSTEKAGVRPIHHVQNHTCWVTLLQPARRAPMSGQPSSLRPHCTCLLCVIFPVQCVVIERRYHETLKGVWHEIFDFRFFSFFIFRCWQANIGRTLYSPVSLTPPKNLSAVSLTPANSFSAVSLTPAINFRPIGYFWQVSKIKNLSLVSTTPAIKFSLVSLTPLNSFSPVSFTPAININSRISLRILKKNSKRPQWNTYGPGGHWFMKKTWARKSSVRLPLRRERAVERISRDGAVTNNQTVLFLLFIGPSESTIEIGNWKTRIKVSSRWMVRRREGERDQ